MYLQARRERGPRGAAANPINIQRYEFLISHNTESHVIRFHHTFWTCSQIAFKEYQRVERRARR